MVKQRCQRAIQFFSLLSRVCKKTFERKENMNDLKIFTNEEFGKVRTVLIEDEVWFVGKDVAEALGYTNSRDALTKHVAQEDKSGVAIYDGSQNRNMTVINESGLYSLILSSKLESAKRFKHWITSEVLPSISRTGGYIQGQETLSEEELMARALEVARKTLERREQRLKQLEQTVSIQNQQISELKPKADYTDTILNSKSLMTITQIAKDYGMSGQAFNKLLHDLGVQYKQGKQWLLYSNYDNLGWTQSETYCNGDNSYLHTKWTQKGRLGLYELLKGKNILPTIEKEQQII